MTNIEWTDKTWNPILGCSKISPGCANCYAIQQAYRNWEMAKAMPEERRGRLFYYEGVTEKISGAKPEWTGVLRFVEEALQIPLRRQKSTRYFVNSMSDLFHESVDRDWIDKIFTVMALCHQHTFQVLTKRPSRMAEYFNNDPHKRWIQKIWEIESSPCLGHLEDELEERKPLSNVHLGISVENRKASRDRIPLLLDIPSRVKFLSCEPLLERLSLSEWLNGLDWVIIGGESGSKSRLCQSDWIRAIVNQCDIHGVPVFVKQMGSNSDIETRDRKGGDINEFPKDLRIRQFPK